MATGFVDRYKGKTAQPVGGMAVGGVIVTPNGYDMNTGLGWGFVYQSTISTASVNMASSGSSGYFIVSAPLTSTGGTMATPPSPYPAGGIKYFAPASSGAPIFQLPPPTPGACAVLHYSTINGSTFVFFKAGTGTVTIQGAIGGGVGGSTLTNTIKSTVTCAIELYGISTSAWLYGGIFPSTVGLLTFSTTT